MKQIVSMLLTTTLLFTLSACGGAPASNAPSAPPSTPPPASQADQPASSSPATPAPSGSSSEPQSESEAPVEEETGSHILVAVFSLAGEQYNVGVVEKGNTSIIADMIVEATGADLFSIEAVTPYPTTYSGLLEISQQENQSNTRPAISGTVEKMEDYDTVFIGYPIWWGDMPSIVKGFLESYDFSGKTVIPFCTHGGSGLANTENTIAGITGAEMKKGLAVAGTTAQNDRDAAQKAVIGWLKEAGPLG